MGRDLWRGRQAGGSVGGRRAGRWEGRVSWERGGRD